MNWFNKKEKKRTSIYAKLHKIQKEVRGLSKDKSSHNFEYVTGNKLLSFIKPLMDKHGLILKQEVMSIENERMDYKVWNKYDKVFKDKSEILSKVMMQFTWIDIETGEKDVNSFGANGQNDWEKGLGSALTYAERYFILKYFHIATDEDDIDNPERKPEDETPTITDEQLLRNCKTLADLQSVFVGLGKERGLKVESIKDELKTKLK